LCLILSFSDLAVLLPLQLGLVGSSPPSPLSEKFPLFFQVLFINTSKVAPASHCAQACFESGLFFSFFFNAFPFESPPHCVRRLFSPARFLVAFSDFLFSFFDGQISLRIHLASRAAHPHSRLDSPTLLVDFSLLPVIHPPLFLLPTPLASVRMVHTVVVHSFPDKVPVQVSPLFLRPVALEGFLLLCFLFLLLLASLSFLSDSLGTSREFFSPSFFETTNISPATYFGPIISFLPFLFFS